MAFTGLSSNDLLSASLVGEDLSPIIATLAPIEAPLLDFLGDSPNVATSTKHEYIEDFLLPNYVIASTAIASASAATAFQVNGLGDALTIGTILENESAAPELMQVSSIIGANSIACTRNYGGGGIGSLVAGGSLFVRGAAGLEGRDHSGANTQRLGNRKANTVGYFSIDIAASGTQLALGTLGANGYDTNRAKVFRQLPSMLEKEVVRGVLNSTNSLGVEGSSTRTMLGIRSQLTAIASTVTATSFAADPHLYLGNVWEQVYFNGAAAGETWAVIAGRTFFRNLSDLNTTKVQDSNASELFKRVIRTYAGPFGQAELFLSRWLPATELLLVPRERVKVVGLQGRSFQYTEMARAGDNVKGMAVGEYTVEVHHPSAMARLYV